VRALIVGAGAVGRYFAARLRLGGHDVVLLARPNSVPQLRSDGITLIVGSQVWPVSVSAASEPGDPLLRDAFELVIIAVKTYSTADAIASVRRIAGCAESTIMTIQNGLGSEEALAAAFGAERVASGALTTAVDRADGTGVIAAPKGGLSFAPVGAVAHNWIIALMQGTGLDVRAVNDWRALKWSKLSINILANGVCAALDWTPSQVYADRDAFAVERACLLETIDVMHALSIAPVALIGFPVPSMFAAARTLPAPLLKAVLTARVASARGAKLPSLLLDVRAGRTRTEVDELNGAVALRARDAGVPAQANACVARIVSGIAAGTVDWAPFRGSPTALMSAAGLR